MLRCSNYGSQAVGCVDLKPNSASLVVMSYSAVSQGSINEPGHQRLGIVLSCKYPSLFLHLLCGTGLLALCSQKSSLSPSFEMVKKRLDTVGELTAPVLVKGRSGSAFLQKKRSFPMASESDVTASFYSSFPGLQAGIACLVAVLDEAQFQSKTGRFP